MAEREAGIYQRMRYAGISVGQIWEKETISINEKKIKHQIMVIFMHTDLKGNDQIIVEQISENEFKNNIVSMRPESFMQYNLIDEWSELK